jgi:hypothetical protein
MLRILCCCLLLSICVQAAERPEWATRTFTGSAADVFLAARASVLEQRHTITGDDVAAGTLHFHVGTSAWSWGYSMVLKVEEMKPGESSVSIDIDRSGGKAVSWGSGSKEVRKIFAGIDSRLRAASPGVQ